MIAALGLMYVGPLELRVCFCCWFRASFSADKKNGIFLSATLA